MKVSNNKIGSPTGQTDTSKLGKTDSSKLQKDAGLAGLSSNKESIRNSSKVNVSSQAQMMQKAKELASGPMSVDEAKVARLQKMIDEGKYSVDADAIADRLVDEHLTIPD